MAIVARDFTDPKTNWKANYDNGTYTGDYFNQIDYSRITNNIAYIAEEMLTKYNIPLIEMEIKTALSIVYADDINAIEENLQTIINLSGQSDMGYGEFGAKYTVNGATIDYTELNRIESVTLALYNNLETELDSKKRMLAFKLGTNGGL